MSQLRKWSRKGGLHVRFLESAPLAAADLQRVAHANAERIFRILA